MLGRVQRVFDRLGRDVLVIKCDLPDAPDGVQACFATVQNRDGRPSTYTLRRAATLDERADRANREAIIAALAGRPEGRFAVRLADAGETLKNKDGFWRVTTGGAGAVIQPEQLGEALGEWLARTAGAGALQDPMPGAHCLGEAYDALLTLSLDDSMGRVSEAAGEIEWLMSVRGRASETLARRAAICPGIVGLMPENVRLTREGGQDVAWIDAFAIRPQPFAIDFAHALTGLWQRADEETNMETAKRFAESCLMRAARLMDDDGLRLLADMPFALAVEGSAAALSEYLRGEGEAGGVSERALFTARRRIGFAKRVSERAAELTEIIAAAAAKYR